MDDPEIHDESPAAAFERFFGPTLFGPWADVLLEHTAVRPGDRVLDLACATASWRAGLQAAWDRTDGLPVWT